MTEEKQESQPKILHNKGITRITVGGFKSIAQEQSIEIRPLTILAGANSSGKSSIMQPLLLLKQTLDATYDPGPLLLNGPNVRFTLVEKYYMQQQARKSVMRCSKIYTSSKQLY
jgi:predicted ATPase